ncbi:MAG: pyridoxal-phosphate dependent enzyme [Nitrososphaerales archaeon]
MIELLCTNCQNLAENFLSWKCKYCGSPLRAESKKPFDLNKVNYSERSLWRYKRFLYSTKVISLGEGNTPIVKLNERCYLKLEYLNPTGSFKDRGSTSLISALYSEIKGKVAVEDSSGNAGASIACYCSRANIRCKIFAPYKIQEAKARQILAFKAKLVRVKGKREKLFKLAIKEASKEGHFYASHIWNPFFILGNTTIAYELLKVIKTKDIHYIFLPVSAGTLLLGLIYGLEKLLKDGAIEYIPKVIACQVDRISPLYHTLKGLSYYPPKRISTIADALVSTKPVRLKEMVNAIKRNGGDCMIAKDSEILKAKRDLARRGFFLEPSSALAYACYKKVLKMNFIKDEKSLILLTGHGLKSNII